MKANRFVFFWFFNVEIPQTENRFFFGYHFVASRTPFRDECFLFSLSLAFPFFLLVRLVRFTPHENVGRLHRLAAFRCVSSATFG